MKTLFEALPNLNIPSDLEKEFEGALAKRIVMSADRKSVRIEIIIPRIVSRRNINALSGHIKHQFFATQDVDVIILESFDVNEKNPAVIFDSYKESISQILLEENLLMSGFFDSAPAEVKENTITFTAGKNNISESVSEAFSVRIKQIFSEKFGVDVEVNLILNIEEKKENDKTYYSDGRPVFRRKSKGRKLEAEEGIGYDFDGEPMPISMINEEMNGIVIKGDIVSFDSTVIKTGSTLFTATVTDYTDSIKIKMFADKGKEKEIQDFLSSEPSVLLKGDSFNDFYEHEMIIQHIKGIKRIGSVRKKRTDDAPEKRIELHCHTKMSEMDGVSDVKDIVKLAADLGHEAIAITDHGVVYAFPDAMNAAKECEAAGKPIKIIYGCEGYLVDDMIPGKTFNLQNARRYHIILLAKNETGRINLYRLVSESHINYFHKRPCIPRSLLNECREGIIVGSACEAGELIRGIVEGEPEEEIERRANFYDYLEIQPLGNNAYMLSDEKHPNINSMEDLESLNRRVIELGEKLGKMVVATCDVHFLNPEDSIYRKIIMTGMGYADADNQPPLYYRTTNEMLAEFSYLSDEKAQEIVIENPKKIASMCEVIMPVRPDKCPPVLEGSEEELREICYKKANDMYGDPLPEIVKTRLDRELDSIIGNGYSVMYVFAQKLVKNANDAGYMVGSRGSVGSSFVATMSDITEVNPLPPHYLCKKCKYSEFDGPEIKANAGNTGYDLPRKICPKCGEVLGKEGIDIPFETFLGFEGNKEPDIDLNFSGEYQSKAHAYTTELFGEGYTFRAGTVSSIADKTAFGFVIKYFEEKDEHKRRCEIERIAKGCMGIRRSSGQHPGGIVVMPKGENIYSFTPIQHPANDAKTGIITTHFDYHKIEQNLLKFDILGHDDPTMMKWLGDMTGVNPKDIALDDPRLYSLFSGLDELGITPEDIGGTPLGTYGIPEFNTDFAMDMLIDAKPKNFADLVNIAGLAHGTDVWLGNARDLILSNTASLQDAICTRDGIMIDLIGYGLDPKQSFTIMESVRKGNVAKGKEKKWDEYKKEMKAHKVPDWYIKSCEKIQYMFPKAHAAAYVMMALRVAFFKIYHPLEFYAAYFGIRADGFDYEKMCFGRERLKMHLDYYKQNYDKLTKLEKDAYNKALRPAEEMYSRGFEFAPIDIYTAEAVKFKVVDGKIMPSLRSIRDMGEKAAHSLEEEARKGKFISKEDLISRTKIPTKLADYMDELGLLGNMPKSNQISLFDIELE